MGDKNQKTDPLAGDNSPSESQGEADAQAEYEKMGGVTDAEAEAAKDESRREAGTPSR